MSYGVYGSTLNDELNRLANGGTYPERQDYKDQAGAAQAWAASENIDLGTVTDLVGVLNYINGVTERSEMLDIAGVCNAIAGTTQLEPAAALREVSGTPAKPVVTGGTLSAYNNYFYRTFTSTEDLGITNGSLDAEVLVIGGGGSGGYGSGGGAGGVVIQSLTLQPGNYTATVGSGGPINNYYANPGSNSSFASITALGGSAQSVNGPAFGGSGAGGMGNDAPFGYGTPGQGFDGGAHAFRAGGGGGGAAGPGGSAGSYSGGAGGAAILLQDWANATGLGVNGYFAGGGGGSGQSASAPGGGGGAGNGGVSSSAEATAVPNTGSGAGSRYGNQSGAGGSGVVIVRYLQTAVA